MEPLSSCSWFETITRQKHPAPRPQVWQHPSAPKRWSEALRLWFCNIPHRWRTTKTNQARHFILGLAWDSQRRSLLKRSRHMVLRVPSIRATGGASTVAPLRQRCDDRSYKERAHSSHILKVVILARRLRLEVLTEEHKRALDYNPATGPPSLWKCRGLQGGLGRDICEILTYMHCPARWSYFIEYHYIA